MWSSITGMGEDHHDLVTGEFQGLAWWSPPVIYSNRMEDQLKKLFGYGWSQESSWLSEIFGVVWCTLMWVVCIIGYPIIIWKKWRERRDHGKH